MMSINYSFGLPLKNNFSEYVYYQGLFLPHEVDRIRGFWDDEQTIKATLSGDKTYDDKLRQSSVMFIDHIEAHQWIYSKLADLGVIFSTGTSTLEQVRYPLAS